MPRSHDRIPWVPFLLALFALAGATAAAAQSRIEYVELEPMPTADGAALYQAYCSSCHGPTGLGNGPAARLLQQPVPDLTRMALRDGEFNLRHVQDHVADAHGHKYHARLAERARGRAFRPPGHARALQPVAPGGGHAANGRERPR